MDAGSLDHSSYIAVSVSPKLDCNRVGTVPRVAVPKVGGLH